MNTNYLELLDKAKECLSDAVYLFSGNRFQLVVS